MVKSYSYSYLILDSKVLSVCAVRHPEFLDPLRIILSTLNAYFGDFHNFTKIHLNPLSFIVCFCWPGTCSSSSCHVVDFGIVWSMVSIPLALKQKQLIRLACSILKELLVSSSSSLTSNIYYTFGTNPTKMSSVQKYIDADIYLQEHDGQ